MCSPGHGPISFDDDHEYVPCLIGAPARSMALTDNGIPGEITIDYGTIGLRLSADMRNAHWPGFDFDGYPCRLMWGEYGAPLSSYKHIPAGRVGSMSVAADMANAQLPLLGPEAELKKEVLKASYAGTGAAESLSDFKGQLKPFAIGFVENIEPPMIDMEYLVYQYHGYGRTEDVVAVYENALTLGAAKYTVATYEELIGLTAEQLPPGTWAKAPAVGMYRLGAEPIGKMTADVIGATDRGQPLTSFGAIAGWMLREIAGIPADMIDMEGAKALDRDFPHTWGNYLDSRDKPEDDSDPAISVGDFLREAASHLAAYVFPDRDGIWRFGRNVSSKTPIMLRQSKASTPIVLSVAMPATATRAHKVRVGGRRCFSTHSDDEISSALKDAVDEAVHGVGQKIDEVQAGVDDIRKNFKSLVLPALVEPIADLKELNLKYGDAIGKAQGALHRENHIAITALGTRVDENGNLVAEQITQLTSRVKNGEATVEAGFKNVRETIAGLDFASASEVTQMIAEYGENVSAAFVEERRVRAEDDKALAESITDMGVRVGDAEGKISELERIVLTPDEGTAESIRELGIKIETETSNREAAIRGVERAYVDADLVLAEADRTLSASIFDATNGNSIVSIINRHAQTQVDANGARAQEINALQTRLNSTNGASYEQNVQLISNINGLMSSQVTFKVQTEVNGTKVVGGLGIINQNGYVDTAFTTDAFSIWTPSGKTPLLTLDGNALRVNTAIMQNAIISGAQITDASIGTLKVAGGAISANQGANGVDTFVAANGSADFLTTGFMTIGDGFYGSGSVEVDFTIDATQAYDASCKIQLWVDTGAGYALAEEKTFGITTDNGNTYSRTGADISTIVTGAQVRVIARVISGAFTPRSVARSQYIRDINMKLIGMKR
ncbi:hypothetical protein M529_20295 [Sphingobium ummariense RL-3]|uniref:Tip attachment protein J central straight fiber domain-containing protein n=2 Tax=Sphingobium TaxID=165695 RepID=T0J0J7_9SPHN|nr:hypothetical protein M529_20295 [Sphingobium ummariense RL-3]